MKYNLEYLEIHYALATSFLLHAKRDILDISYTRKHNDISIQIVLPFGVDIDAQLIQKVKSGLAGFDVHIMQLNLTIAQFNETIGDWQPKHYQWLEHVLFSKSQVL